MPARCLVCTIWRSRGTECVRRRTRPQMSAPRKYFDMPVPAISPPKQTHLPQRWDTHILHLNLQLDPLAVRFRPDETSIDQSDLRQSTQSPQTQRHQLLRLQLCSDPMLRRLQPPLTSITEMYRRLSLDALGNINVHTNAGLAHRHARRAAHGRTTCGAEDVSGRGRGRSVGCIGDWGVDIHGESGGWW